jgi:polyhydroxyalkanoate synthase
MTTTCQQTESETPNPLDALTRSGLGRVTQGLSPAAMTQAYMDWLVHLAISPGKQQELREKAQRKLTRLLLHETQLTRGASTPCIEPLPQDERFKHPDWQRPPFLSYYQSFLLLQQWWWNATTGVHGVTRHHEYMVTFFARQWLDMFSPSNFLSTNPEVLSETVRTAGMNLAQGAANLWEDALTQATGKPPVGAEQFQVGKNLALTPGKVILRDRLIELIQYAPQTATVHPEPVLIVPSWIMKYYILDLSPANSLVKYLVDAGHTVFMLSWKNPGAEDRDLGMDNYLRDGVLAALDAVSSVVRGHKINAVGYCLGGTLLGIAASALARDGDTRLNSLSLLASELDFTEPGELSLFVDESQIAFLEDAMWTQGYLDGKQMAGAFALLNSRDLVWSKMIHSYLMGQRAPLTDLMAWNIDATRLPYRMHSEYLRQLYLNNDLAEGNYRVGGRPVALTDIRVPCSYWGRSATMCRRGAPSTRFTYLPTQTSRLFSPAVAITWAWSTRPARVSLDAATRWPRARRTAPTSTRMLGPRKRRLRRGPGGRHGRVGCGDTRANGLRRHPWAGEPKRMSLLTTHRANTS